MKWLCSALLAFCVVSPLAVAEASTVVRTGDSVSVASDQRVDGNFYALGGNVSLSGDMLGDVVVGAGTVSINAPVAHDVLAIGGTVGVHATVTEDVRIVGGDVTISQAVEGSVFVVGGRVSILSTAVITGDVLVLAGDAVIEGEVKGQILGVAERARVDAVVGGIDIDSSSLTLGDRAKVAGDITYTSPTDLVRAPGAVVNGSIVRNDSVGATPEAVSYRGMAMAFLVSLFASLTLYLVARRPLTLYARQATHNIAREALIGFALLVTIPVAIMILMVSVLGLFIGLIGLATFLLVAILAVPLMNITLGALIGRTFMHSHDSNVLLITLGALGVQMMLFVPVIGPILLFVLFLITIGGVATGLYRLLRLS